MMGVNQVFMTIEIVCYERWLAQSLGKQKQLRLPKVVCVNDDDDE